jgi:hypothetical protein
MFVDPCIIVQFIKKNPTRCNNVSKFYYSILYKAQHVSDDTPPIIRSLKLHWQALIFHMWKVVGCVRHSMYCAWHVHQLHIQQPSMHAKPKAANAVLGSWWWEVCRLKHVELHITWNNKILIHWCILLDFFYEFHVRYVYCSYSDNRPILQ